MIVAVDGDDGGARGVVGVVDVVGGGGVGYFFGVNIFRQSDP